MRKTGFEPAPLIFAMVKERALKRGRLHATKKTDSTKETDL